LQEDNQQLQLRKISAVGDFVQQVEYNCELSKVEFLKSTYKLIKIKEISNEPDFKTLLGAILVKISILSGIKGEIDDFIKQDISKMILSSFKELSLEEICKAFELERYGQYETKTEHYQLFDSNYISQILKKYKNWKTKEKIELNLVAPKEEVEISEKEKSELKENMLKMIFDEIKETGFSSDAWHLYINLESSGKIKPTPEQKSALYKEQLRIYEIEEKALIRNKYGITMSKPYLKSLTDKITGKKPVESVSNKCRSILASKYLKDFLIDFETFKKQAK